MKQENPYLLLVTDHVLNNAELGEDFPPADRAGLNLTIQALAQLPNVDLDDEQRDRKQALRRVATDLYKPYFKDDLRNNLALF